MDELLYQLLSRLGSEDLPLSMRSGLGDGFVPDDEPYLRQFLGVPKEGGLIPTDVRPSNLKVSDSLPWYQPTANPLTMVVKHPGNTSTPKAYRDLDSNLIDRLLPGQTLPIEHDQAPGLGGYTASIGKHPDGRPYASVYDKWDFDSPVIKPTVGKLLDKLGKPFHVYGRYPLIKQGDRYKIFSGNEDIPLPDK